MKSFLFVLIAVIAVPAAAEEFNEDSDSYFPQQLNARDLVTACASSSLTATGRLRQRYCLGFVSGVEESLRLLQSRNPDSASSPICVPNGTTARALADVFIRYASRSGVDLEQPSASVVFDALAKGFPC